MLTVAITHVVNPSDVQPLTPEDLALLLGHRPLPQVAVGTNWRNKTGRDWESDQSRRGRVAQVEFPLMFRLAKEGGYVVANYHGLRRGQRWIGRVAPTKSGLPDRVNGLRAVPFAEARLSGDFDWVRMGLWTGRGRSIKDISERAGDNIAVALRSAGRVAGSR